MAKRKKSRLILLLILLVFLAIQFIPVDRSIPETDPGSDFIAMYSPPDDVATLLRSACYDCHSYETTYPWYSYVAPLGGWIQGHIKHGRGSVNFSTWSDYPAEDQKKFLDEIAEEIAEKQMPLTSYTWLHSEARLTDEDRELLVSWFDEQE